MVVMDIHLLLVVISVMQERVVSMSQEQMWDQDDVPILDTGKKQKVQNSRFLQSPNDPSMVIIVKIREYNEGRLQ